MTTKRSAISIQHERCESERLGRGGTRSDDRDREGDMRRRARGFDGNRASATRSPGGVEEKRECVDHRRCRDADIDLGEWADLGESERLAVNVDTLYADRPGRPWREGLRVGCARRPS